MAKDSANGTVLYAVRQSNDVTVFAFCSLAAGQAEKLLTEAEGVLLLIGKGQLNDLKVVTACYSDTDTVVYIEIKRCTGTWDYCPDSLET